MIKSTPDYRPTKRLLDIAKPILQLPDDYTTHFWLSDTKLMLITGEIRQDAEGLVMPSNWRGKAEVLDTKTGKRTRLVRFTRLLNDIHGEPHDFQWSPKHRWLKWLNFQTGDGWPFPVVARLNGTGQIQ